MIGTAASSMNMQVYVCYDTNLSCLLKKNIISYFSSLSLYFVFEWFIFTCLLIYNLCTHTQTYIYQCVRTLAVGEKNPWSPSPPLYSAITWRISISPWFLSLLWQVILASPPLLLPRLHLLGSNQGIRQREWVKNRRERERVVKGREIERILIITKAPFGCVFFFLFPSESEERRQERAKAIHNTFSCIYIYISI